jgi:hypothetical protein
MKKFYIMIKWDVKDFGIWGAVTLWAGFIARKICTGNWYEVEE